MVTPPSIPPPGIKAPHLGAGVLGEEAAAAYLTAKGLSIIARNWRKKWLEIDIIARHNATIVFVEVKTRHNAGLTMPHEALTPKKQQCLIKATTTWLGEQDLWHLPCRFDLVCISGKTDIHSLSQLSLVQVRKSAARQGAAARRSDQATQLATPWAARFLQRAMRNIETKMRCNVRAYPFSVEHIPHAFTFSEPLGSSHTAWQPW